MGGKLFLYEVKKLIKKKKILLGRDSKKEKKRSPSSLKASKGEHFFLYSSSFSLPQHLGNEENKLYEDFSQKGLRELLRLKSIDDQNKRMRIKK